MSQRKGLYKHSNVFHVVYNFLRLLSFLILSVRAPERRSGGEGVHPEDVCRPESRQRQNHLFALYLRDRHGKHPLRLRRRQGHHLAAQPEGVQPGVDKQTNEAWRLCSLSLTLK